MMLADLGADVIRVERSGGGSTNLPVDLLNRGRRSLGVNLKRPEGAELVLKLVETADILLEGFRPGVAERLGIGPEVCLARNPKVVYGRITGWGQDGPLAPRAGHDLNYIGIAGALDPIGHADGPPVIPLNLVADFGGGGMLLAFGVVSALLEAQRSGKGQVVDAAMVDGSSLLTTMFHGLLASGMWQTKRGSNMLDGGAPFYQVYETKDGQHMAAGGIEPKFYAEMLRGLGLEGADLPFQYDQGQWPAMRARFAEIFRTKTRDEWTEIFEDRDACVTPVLSLTEAGDHRHNQARGTFVEVDGVRQPAPAPRFSRTPNAVPKPPVKAGQHTDEILAELGLGADEISALRSDRTVG
jgi:alpha-methylacyl-CoA racemase